MEDSKEIGNNPLFELVYEDEEVREGDIDTCVKFLREQEGMKICHMNVCGINSKYNTLTTFFQAIKADFDILVLSEAHLKSIMNIEQFNFGDFNIYGTSYNIRKTDGLLIYVKSSISHEVQEIKITDCNFIKLRYKQGNKQFLCLSFYRSPSGKIEKFLDELEHILENDREQADIRIITGDININILDCSKNETDRYLNILATNGYLSQLKRPTRIGKKSNSCLDHFFVKAKPGTDQTAFIVNTQISDHYPIILNIRTEKRTPYEKQHSCVNYKINLENLKQNLENQNWNEVYSCVNAETATDTFINHLKNLINQNSEKVMKKVQKKK